MNQLSKETSFRRRPESLLQVNQTPAFAGVTSR
jgi:hypothetical protein